MGSSHLKCLGLLFGVWALTSCASAYKASLGGETDQVLAKIYFTDFNTAWQSALDAVKNSRLDVTNREGGLIQTRWTDNTAEKNLADSVGNQPVYLKAQYRFKISVAKGFWNGKPSVKVSVQKDQVIQHDVLEGLRPAETDGVEERTLLYRIGRLIYIRGKIARIEEEKTKRAIENSELEK